MMPQSAQDLLSRLETAYQFECEAGPLKNCREWHELKHAVETAITALKKTKQEFHMAGKLPGYIGSIYVDAGLAALSSGQEPSKP